MPSKTPAKRRRSTKKTRSVRKSTKKSMGSTRKMSMKRSTSRKSVRKSTTKRRSPMKGKTMKRTKRRSPMKRRKPALKAGTPISKATIAQLRKYINGKGCKVPASAKKPYLVRKARALKSKAQKC